MRDFSFFYGPIRTWLTVVATVALVVAVFVHHQGKSVADQDCPVGGDCNGRLAFCDDAETADVAGAGLDVGCVTPAPSGEAVDAGTTEPSVEPMSVNTEAGEAADDDTADEEEDPWADVERSGSDVPFVSLQPSDEGLTDAGQGLIPTTTPPPSAPTTAQAIEPRSASTVDAP